MALLQKPGLDQVSPYNRRPKNKSFTDLPCVDYGVSIHFFRGHTDIFQMPYKCFFPCPIAITFSPVIGYGLKFVKM